MFNILKSYYRFYVPLLILLIVWVIGTIGYMLIEHYTLLDAFYMTVITVSTVGYSEIAPLSDNGKLYTAFLIITSFGTFAYAISSITKFVIDGELNEFFKNRKLNSRIEKLTDHVIICGYGRNGRQAAQVLKKHHKRFVVIDNNLELISNLNHQFSDLVIHGNSTSDNILIKAGILKAKAIIVTLPVDSDNLFIVLTARNLNKKIKIIARASEDSSDKKLKIAGADNVIMPDKVGGAHMASLVMKPDVMEFLEHITDEGDQNMSLDEITLTQVKFKTLKDIQSQNTSGATIIGLKHQDGIYVVNPNIDTNLIIDTKLFVLGTSLQIAALKEMLC